MPYTHYVIELDRAVLESKKVREKNPDHRPEKRLAERLRKRGYAVWWG